MRRVRINRGERQVPFLSNIVKGEALQITPNGQARSAPETCEGELTGFATVERVDPPPTCWPGSNRSGE